MPGLHVCPMTAMHVQSQVHYVNQQLWLSWGVDMDVYLFLCVGLATTFNPTFNFGKLKISSSPWATPSSEWGGRTWVEARLTVMVWVVEGRLLVTTAVLLGSYWSVGSCTPACPNRCVRKNRKNKARKTDCHRVHVPSNHNNFLSMNALLTQVYFRNHPSTWRQ